MGKPKAPATPDYAAAAQEQGIANVNSALATNYLNQPNQVGPDGSLTFEYNNDNGMTLPDGTFIPSVTARTQLSPAQQKLYDQNNQISTALNDLAGRGVGYVDQAVSSPLTPGQLPGGGQAPGVSATTSNVQGSNFQSSVPKSQLAGQYDYSGASRLPTMDDFASQRDQVTNALMQRLDPQITRDRAALDSKLANQGINAGAEAYGTEHQLQEQGVNDARIQTLLAGSQEQQRLFGNAMAARQQGIGEAQAQGQFGNEAAKGNFAMDAANADLYNSTQADRFQQGLTNANLQNSVGQQIFNQGLAGAQYQDQARQLALQEADYFKNQPLNMLNALRTGNQVQMPSFGNVATGAQIAAAPIYAATNDAYQGELAKYQAKSSVFGDIMGGLAGIGGAAITKSDRRLKTNVREVGRRANGLGVYLFNYLATPLIERFGYMADEVEKLFPEAVIYGPDGFASVNYGKVR